MKKTVLIFSLLFALGALSGCADVGFFIKGAAGSYKYMWNSMVDRGKNPDRFACLQDPECKYKYLEKLEKDSGTSNCFRDPECRKQRWGDEF